MRPLLLIPFYHLLAPLQAYYLTNQSFATHWRFDRHNEYLANSNDTFYLPTDAWDLQSTCEVQLENQLFVVDESVQGKYNMYFSNNSMNSLSPVVAVNKTYVAGIRLIEDSPYFYLLEYRVQKFTPTLAFEIAVFVHKTANFVRVEYREIILDRPFVKHHFGWWGNYEGTVSLYVAKDLNLNFEVCAERYGIDHKVFLKVRGFNKTYSNQF